jgi:hypothetical protein
MKRVKVIAYSGYRAEERPMRFELEGKEIMVKEVISEWRDEEGWGFMVTGDDAREYFLKYLEKEDCWSIEKR